MRKPRRQAWVKTVTVTVNTDSRTEFGKLQASFLEKFVWQICDWRILPQGWRRILRKRFARNVKGPFDVVHEGMKFRLYPAENYCDRVLFGRNQLPEPAEHEALAGLIRPGMVFVDIGANVGSYCIFVGKKAGGNLTILAFEPHPRTYEKLAFNLKANGLPTSMVFNLGVAAERGVVDLWSDGGSNVGHTSMLKAGTANPKISHTVKVVPLIDMLKQNAIGRIDLLKIDIEGFEDRALASFFDVAPNSLLPAHLLIETAHRHLWLRSLLPLIESRGYKVRFETHENKLYSRI